MAIDFTGSASSDENGSERVAASPVAVQTPQIDLRDQPEAVQTVDVFDTDRHNDLLNRLEHELALVDAALSHIDDDDLDAADTAIKELSRHNDDGQVALPLR